MPILNLSDLRAQDDENPRFVHDLIPSIRSYPLRAPAIPVFHEYIGHRPFGYVQDGGFWRDPSVITAAAWKALCRDERAFAKRRYEQHEKAMYQMAAAITSFNDIINARANGHAQDLAITKASQTTVASAWSSFARSTGQPGAIAFTNIPTGAVFNGASTGAVPITVPGSGKRYLLNFGGNHATGNNITLLADILVGGGNVTTNVVTTAQTVTTAALTRYTGTAAAGNMITYDVTTLFGGVAANLTTLYTNQAGTGSQSTGAIALTTAAATFRLQPTGAPWIPLASGDTGVRAIDSATVSALMGGGVMAAMIYRPIVFIPMISSTAWVERSTPGQLSGITELVQGTDSQLGCLVPFVLTSGTSTGVQTYFLQTCDG